MQIKTMRQQLKFQWKGGGPAVGSQGTSGGVIAAAGGLNKCGGLWMPLHYQIAVAKNLTAWQRPGIILAK